MDADDEDDMACAGPAAKERKPYILTMQRKSWSIDEHNKFQEALQLFDRDWKKIENHVGTKNVVQIRSHAQKFFAKIIKQGGCEASIPPARPKRKHEDADGPTHAKPRQQSSSHHAEHGAAAAGAAASAQQHVSAQQHQQSAHDGGGSAAAAAAARSHSKAAKSKTTSAASDATTLHLQQEQAAKNMPPSWMMMLQQTANGGVGALPQLGMMAPPPPAAALLQSNPGHSTGRLPPPLLPSGDGYGSGGGLPGASPRARTALLERHQLLQQQNAAAAAAGLPPRFSVFDSNRSGAPNMYVVYSYLGSLFDPLFNQADHAEALQNMGSSDREATINMLGSVTQQIASSCKLYSSGLQSVRRADMMAAPPPPPGGWTLPFLDGAAAERARCAGVGGQGGPGGTCYSSGDCSHQPQFVLSASGGCAPAPAAAAGAPHPIGGDGAGGCGGLRRSSSGAAAASCHFPPAQLPDAQQQQQHPQQYHNKQDAPRQRQQPLIKDELPQQQRQHGQLSPQVALQQQPQQQQPARARQEVPQASEYAFSADYESNRLPRRGSAGSGDDGGTSGSGGAGGSGNLISGEISDLWDADLSPPPPDDGLNDRLDERDVGMAADEAKELADGRDAASAAGARRAQDIGGDDRRRSPFLGQTFGDGKCMPCGVAKGQQQSRRRQDEPPPQQACNGRYMDCADDGARDDARRHGDAAETEVEAPAAAMLGGGGAADEGLDSADGEFDAMLDVAESAAAEDEDVDFDDM